MFMHLLKLVWKRKTRQLLLSVEIALSFMLVFAVALTLAYLNNLRSLPLGFEYENTWAVEILPLSAASAPALPEGGAQPRLDSTTKTPTNDKAELLKQVKQLVRSLPEVEQSAFVQNAPFVQRTWTTRIVEEGNAGNDQPTERVQLDEDAAALLAMSLSEGRWFQATDKDSGLSPAVINRQLADALFQGQSPLGKTVVEGQDSDSPRFRIVGVVPTFRPRGEYQTPGPNLLSPLTGENWKDDPRATLLVKLRAGTDRAFELKLLQALQRAQPGWEFAVKPLTELAEAERADMNISVMVLLVIAGFMFLMVAFGLFGVLWQHTTQRISEFGLRRALGATTQSLQWQLVGEQSLLSTLSILAASLILVQIPLTGEFGDLLSWPLFIMALSVAAALILLLSVLCAWYPAWRAGRLSPVNALRYE